MSLPAQPTGPVNDYAHALTPVQLSQLDAQLRGWERGTTQQIAVAIFKSLEGESLEDVSIRLAEKWKIGGKASSDGVLMTLFLDDHKLRIEVGYGLEGKLTDAIAARIIRDVMAPKLRQNDLAGAINAGVTAIHSTITTGKPPDIEPAVSSHHDSGAPMGLIMLFIFIVIAIVIIGAISNARGGGGWTSSGSSWSSSDSSSSWSSSDSSSSSSSSDWSGGGGSFGGGGASGSW